MRGDPDTDRKRAAGHEFLAPKCMAFHLFAQALTDFLRIHAVGFGKNDRELFPPITGDRI